MIQEKFAVLELQLNSDEAAPAHLTDTYTSRVEAESAYYMKVASAILSQVPVHTVMLLSSDGVLLEHKCCDHQSE